MEPTKLYTSVNEAQATLLAAAFPDADIASGDPGSIDEGAAFFLIAAAEVSCAEGDEAMCAVLRSWMWHGAVTALEGAGFSLILGTNEGEAKYAAFINGEAVRPAPGESTQPADIIPFPTRS